MSKRTAEFAQEVVMHIGAAIATGGPMPLLNHSDVLRLATEHLQLWGKIERTGIDRILHLMNEDSRSCSGVRNASRCSCERN